jgi:hypothetical protein
MRFPQSWIAVHAVVGKRYGTYLRLYRKEGRTMVQPVFADVFGLPVYYVDTAVPEPAGDGNVRVFNCVTRNGVLIPQCEIIIHSARLVIAARVVAETAAEISAREALLRDLHVH